MTEERWQKVLLSILSVALVLRIGLLTTMLIALLVVTVLWIWDTEEVDG